MAAVSVKLVMQLLARLNVVLPAGYSGGAASQTSYRTVVLDDYGADVVLDGDNTPTPTAAVAKSYTIGAGITTVDLTAAPVIGAVDGSGNPAASESLTGYKLQGVLFETPSTNVGNVNIAPGASNPYPIFGTANDIDLPPYSNLAFLNRGSDLPDVAAAVKTLDVSGTATDVLNVILIFEA